MNLFISIANADWNSSNKHFDQCNWYMITQILDTTCGLGICILLMKLLDKALVQLNLSFLISGNYFKEEAQMSIGNIGEEIIQKKPEIKIDFIVWLLQTIIWCSIVL